MNAIQRAIRRARRRLVLSWWLQWTGRAALGGLGCGVVVLALTKTQVTVAPWWTYLVIVAVAVVTASVLTILRGRATDASVAARVDDRLKLKDRLSTAVWAESIRGDPFAEFVMQDAERAASQIDADAALRIEPGRCWSWSAAGWAVVALAAVFVQPFDLFGLDAQRQGQLAQAQQEDEAVEQMIEAASLVKEIERPQGQLAEADPQQAMRELIELTRRDLSNPQMKREAVARLSEAQQQLAEAYAAQENQARMQQNALSALDTQQSGPADRFADALRRGNYEQAQKELEELIRKVEQGELSDADKQALQNQLQNMANQLQQMAQQAAAQQQQMQQQANQQLAQQGLSPQQIQQIQQSGYNSQQIQQALQQQGMSQSQAQQQAQQMSQQMQQRQSQQQAGSMSQGLCQSMNQMAQCMGQGQGQSQSQGSGQGMGAAGYGAQQQLAQMQAQMQQMQQMQQAQQQMYNALHNLNASQGQGAGQPGGQGAAAGGRQWGTGQGGPPLGAEKNLTGQYQTQAEGDLKDRDGRIIASWQTEGEVVAGDLTVDYNTAITQARAEAERAVADDRVPRRYHGAIGEYFNQLPASPDDVRKAPAAPR